jgi:uncharacterized protein YuzE
MAHILRDEPFSVFEYDGDAKALYYRLTREPVSRTVSIGDRVNVDVDADGQAVGVEVLNPPGFTMTVSTTATARSPFSLSDDDIARARAGHQGTVDFIAGGHLGTPCPKPRDGGLCGCDEADLDDAPRDCYRGRCDC